MLLSVNLSLSRNQFKFENEKWNLRGDWTYLQNSGITTVYYSEDFPSSTASDQHVLSSSEMIQNISKIYPKYIQNIQNICKEDLAKKSLTEDTYTYIYRYKDDKDTENFKIFLCALFILESLETTMTITWNKYSKHPLVPLLDYLHHTAETCRSGGVIPYYTHSS